MTPAPNRKRGKKVEQVVVGVGYDDNLGSQPFGVGLSERGEGASSRRAAQLVLTRLV